MENYFPSPTIKKNGVLGDAHLIRALRGDLGRRPISLERKFGGKGKEKLQWLSASCVYVGMSQKPQSIVACSEAPDFVF